MIAASFIAETGNEPPDAPASPDPRLRDRRPAPVGAARCCHGRRVAAAMVELGRPGVSPPGVERGRAGCVLRPVRSAGAHRAQRLGLPLGSRGDGLIEPEGRVRPSDRRARRRRIAVAFRPVLHGPTGDRCGPLRARAAAGGRRDLLGRSARCLWRDAAAAPRARQRPARHFRLHKAARRLWAGQRPEHLGGGAGADAAGDACAGPRSSGNRRPFALSRLDHDRRRRRHGPDLRPGIARRSVRSRDPRRVRLCA